MTENTRSSTRSWVIGGLIAAVLLLFCVVGSCCLYGALGTMSSVTDASTGAEVYRGRPIGDCYEASFASMLRCGNADFMCRLDGQALFMRCRNVADAQPGFCDDHADSRGYCDARCVTAPDVTSCQMVCGQLSVPVGEYCAAPPSTPSSSTPSP